MTTSNSYHPHDFASDVVAKGRAVPENPALYNAIRQGIADWLGSTGESYVEKDSENWYDGLARYIVVRIKWASEVSNAT